MEKLKFEREKTMKKGFKKGLSVLVGVLMLISMMPIGAMAEEATAVNGAAVNQSGESVDSQGNSALTSMPNSLTMPSANDPMVNVRNNIPGEPAAAESGIDPAQQTVTQTSEITESIQTSAIEGDFGYVAVEGGVSISLYNKSKSVVDVVIPGTLGGKKVVAIGEYAFYDCSSLTNVTIPDSVTSIGSSAFNGCSSLTSVTIPDGVTNIGSWAFQKCSSLTTINIPDSVTNIGYGAFEECSRLTNITIPNSVTTIGGRVFDKCTGLTSIDVDVNNLNYSSLDGILFDKAVTTLIACPGGKVSITIPNSVTTIGDYIFYECSGLTSITIPNSVTAIGRNAFDGCSSLTTVTIPNGVTNIEYMTFYGCSSLTNVTLPDRVTSIGSMAFRGCSSLTSITIPDSVTSIGFFAFDGCSSLTTVTIPDSVTSIGCAAFLGCSSLTSIQINSANTTIIDTGGDGIPGRTFPTSATIIGHNPSTAKDFAVKYNRTFIEIENSEKILPTSISLNKTNLNLTVGNSYELIPTLSPNDITDKTITWDSNNSDIATVDSSGNVTGIDEGTAIITATTSNNLSEKCTVNVKKSPVTNPDPSISYQTHVENVGWQDWRTNGNTSGTYGRSLRLEGISVYCKIKT
ncbi:leucine-rich repeat protein [Acetobacterium fimetarium]|uniref:Leucine-rich repeat protein n=1 Tax=Acetobacterium fimetarium TaxID=52691 RepID=A0ABR6WUI0_9FIRM|nr:leucine-rich repeat protein [Acetobacterium fimetarium]MBC3804257.1 leucine-rich repeat protein [Acetobacterium fimetarium]